MLGATTPSSSCGPGLLLLDHWTPAWCAYGPRVSTQVFRFNREWRWAHTPGAHTHTRRHTQGTLWSSTLTHRFSGLLNTCTDPLQEPDPLPKPRSPRLLAAPAQGLLANDSHSTPIPIWGWCRYWFPQKMAWGTRAVPLQLPALRPSVTSFILVTQSSGVFWNTYVMERGRDAPPSEAADTEIPLAPVIDTTDCGAPTPPVWLQQAPNRLTVTAPVIGT